MSRLERTVDLPALHRHAPERYPFLLQSTAHINALGRFDILFAMPAEALVLDSPGKLSGVVDNDTKRFLDALDAWWQREKAAVDKTPLPFTGGWFLYLGYELAEEIEPALALDPDHDLPTAFAVRCPAAIIHDRATGETRIVVEDEDGSMDEQIRADIRACREERESPDAPNSSQVNAREEHPPHFLTAVSRAKEYISRGDIYQANLSRGWLAESDEEMPADQIYAALCATNPAPFAGLVRWGNSYIISSSPERLLRIRDGIASTRPIAGTRPRSDDREIDDTLSAELFAHPKERAEHIMLIDLERNDIGRVSEPGSVEVDEMMVLESYAHVHHIVSNVRGRMKTDVTPGDAIRAVFPGGTITGCPKVRCMEIIHELENGPRGAYTGSIGYLNRDGSLDLNILIRTMVMSDRGISVRAGSGIVADSDPEAELAETRAKAKGMLQALTR